MATTMLDLDGVVYPFNVAFHRWASANAGVQLSDCVEWHFYRDWGWDDGKFVEQLAQFAEEGGFAEEEPFAGSQIAVQALVDAGHAVHVVTDRPIVAEADTAWWIDTYFPGVTSLTITRDKTVFKDYGDPTYFAIDDRIENVEALRTKGVFAYLLTRQWNMKSDLPRVADLDEYVRIVNGEAHRD